MIRSVRRSYRWFLVRSKGSALNILLMKSFNSKNNKLSLSKQTLNQNRLQDTVFVERGLFKMGKLLIKNKKAVEAFRVDGQTLKTK